MVEVVIQSEGECGSGGDVGGGGGGGGGGVAAEVGGGDALDGGVVTRLADHVSGGLATGGELVEDVYSRRLPGQS